MRERPPWKVPLATCLLMMASGAQAVNLQVDNTSSGCKSTGPGTATSPFCQIGSAVAVANAGDTVDVRAGNYAETVKIERSGTAGSPLKIVARPGVTVTSGTYAFDLAGVSYVEVRGFRIANTGSDAIRAVLCSDGVIADNTITFPAGIGINVRDSSDMVLSGNRVDNSGSYGAYLYRSQALTVTGGHVRFAGQPVSGMTRSGIYLRDTNDSTVRGVLAANNTDAGIYTSGTSTNNLIRRNRATDNARGYVRAAPGIEIRGASGNTVSGNRSWGNEDTGVQIYSLASDNLVVDNIAYSNGDHGVDVLNSQGNRIIGNSVHANVTAGINVEGASQEATVQNNISVDNGIDSPRTSGNIRIDSTSITGVTLNDNLTSLSQPGPGAYAYTWGSVKYRSLANLRAAVPAVESRGLESDPLWVDRASGDLSLSGGSPAIDSANSSASGQSAVDLRGHRRTDDPGTPNTGSGSRKFDDRGALEYP